MKKLECNWLGAIALGWVIVLGGCGGDDAPPDATPMADAGLPDPAPDADPPGPCAENEHVQSNTCVRCPSGTTNEASDIPSGTDTICDDACTEVLGVYCSDFEQAYIKASNTDDFDDFGTSVALDGDTLVVGAYQESSRATGVGADQSDNSAERSGAVYVRIIAP